jgi:hypothetical protein
MSQRAVGSWKFHPITLAEFINYSISHISLPHFPPSGSLALPVKLAGPNPTPVRALFSRPQQAKSGGIGGGIARLSKIKIFFKQYLK